MDISRRQLAGVILASTVVGQSAAQAPPKPQPDTEVDTARQRQKTMAQAIARVPLPMTVEPAFQFKA